MTRSLLLIPGLSLALAAPAQPQSPEGTSRERVEPVTASEYSAPRSRALFASLDGNGDDRIDLLEAAGLKTLAGVTDLDSFRRLDANRDGHLDWQEFDAHFRDLIAHGQVLRLRPARPERLDEEGRPAPSDPAERLLALFDESGDGELDRDELGRLLQQVGARATLLSQFERLDRDESGTVSVTEFRPFLSLFPAGMMPDLVAPTAGSVLPDGFGSYDLDRDGRIDAAELGRFLWRLDPSLQRWQRTILKRADRDGDGTLGADEIARSLGAEPPESAKNRSQAQ